MVRLIPLVLFFLCTTAQAGLLSETQRGELVTGVLEHFWGSAKLSNGEPVQPSSENERTTVPVSKEIASRVLDTGEISGLAEWCGLDWQTNYMSLTEAARRNGLSEKQVAFVSVLHGAAQGLVSSSMTKARSCGEPQRAKVRDALERFGERGFDGAFTASP